MVILERLTLLNISASSFLVCSLRRVLVLRVPTCLLALQVRNPLSGFADATSLTVLGVLALGTELMLSGALTLILMRLDRSCMIRVSVAI